MDLYPITILSTFILVGSCSCRVSIKLLLMSEIMGTFVSFSLAWCFETGRGIFQTKMAQTD